LRIVKCGMLNAGWLLFRIQHFSSHCIRVTVMIPLLTTRAYDCAPTQARVWGRAEGNEILFHFFNFSPPVVTRIT
jgi:hypothetical protein